MDVNQPLTNEAPGGMNAMEGEEKRVKTSGDRWSWADQADTMPLSKDYLNKEIDNYNQGVFGEVWPSTASLTKDFYKTWPRDRMMGQYMYYSDAAGGSAQQEVDYYWTNINVVRSPGPAMNADPAYLVMLQSITNTEFKQTTMTNTRVGNSIFSGVSDARSAAMVAAAMATNDGTSCADVITRILLRGSLFKEYSTGVMPVANLNYSVSNSGVYSHASTNAFPGELYPGTSTLIDALWVTYTDFVAVLSGQYSGPWPTYDFGKGTAIVPLRQADLGRGRANTEWTCAHLEHPMDIWTTTTAQWDDTRTQWIDSPTTHVKVVPYVGLTSVPGPVSRVLFVVVDSTSTSTGVSGFRIALSAPGVADQVLDSTAYFQSGATPVDILPTLRASVSNVSIVDKTMFSQTLKRWLDYYGSREDFTTASLAAADHSFRYDYAVRQSPGADSTNTGEVYSRNIDGDYPDNSGDAENIDNLNDANKAAIDAASTTASGMFANKSETRPERETVGPESSSMIPGGDGLIRVLQAAGRLVAADRITWDEVPQTADSMYIYLVHLSTWLTSITDMALSQSSIGTWLHDFSANNTAMQSYRGRFLTEYNKMLRDAATGSKYQLVEPSPSGAGRDQVITWLSAAHGYAFDNSWSATQVPGLVLRLEVEWLLHWLGYEVPNMEFVVSNKVLRTFKNRRSDVNGTKSRLFENWRVGNNYQKNVIDIMLEFARENAFNWLQWGYSPRLVQMGNGAVDYLWRYNTSCYKNNNRTLGRTGGQEDKLYKFGIGELFAPGCLYAWVASSLTAPLDAAMIKLGTRNDDLLTDGNFVLSVPRTVWQAKVKRVQDQSGLGDEDVDELGDQPFR